MPAVSKQLYIPEELDHELRDLAQKSGRAVNYVIMDLIRIGLATAKAEAARTGQPTQWALIDLAPKIDPRYVRKERQPAGK